MKRLEIIAICLTLLSSMALSFYHISKDGFLGLTAIGWAVVWSVAVNILSISFVLYIITKESGLMRKFWGATFLPYFFVKLVYDISAYGHIYILPLQWWNRINIFMIDLTLAGLLFYLIISFREKRD